MLLPHLPGKLSQVWLSLHPTQAFSLDDVGTRARVFVIPDGLQVSFRTSGKGTHDHSPTVTPTFKVKQPE